LVIAFSNQEETRDIEIGSFGIIESLKEEEEEDSINTYHGDLR